MNKSQIVYTNFTMDRLQEAVKMVVDSFEVNNVFSKEGLETREELEFRTSVSIQLFHNAMIKFNEENKTNYQFIKVLLYQGKLVAMIMVSELHIFIDDMLSLLDPEDPYYQAYKELNKETYPKNSTLISSLLSVHKDYMKESLSFILALNMAREWAPYGFKHVVGGSTNPFSLKIALKFGAKLKKQHKIIRNGKSASLYMIQGDAEVILKLLPKL